MKRNEVMALIATTILMFAVCLSASAKGKRNVERGMTKQEVIAILGEPKLTSFDMFGDNGNMPNIIICLEIPSTSRSSSTKRKGCAVRYKNHRTQQPDIECTAATTSYSTHLRWKM